jgi:predicted negative regulator of RcsB-dependent stress response
VRLTGLDFDNLFTSRLFKERSVEFETEEQQVEAIKKWFKEYGITILVGLVLGISGMFGYRYYIEMQENEKAAVSDAYQETIALYRADADNSVFIEAAAKFSSEHKDTIYNNLMAFQLAKVAVAEKDLATAEQHLQTALNQAQHPIIEHLARLRLARVLVASDKADQALSLIADVDMGAYQGSYEMVRGDIWMAKGDAERAKSAYEKAKSLNVDGPVHPSLEMLLTELAGESSAAKVTAE